MDIKEFKHTMIPDYHSKIAAEDSEKVLRNLFSDEEIGFMKQYAKVYGEERQADLAICPIVTVKNRATKLVNPLSEHWHKEAYVINNCYDIFYSDFETVVAVIEKEKNGFIERIESYLRKNRRYDTVEDYFWDIEIDLKEYDLYKDDILSVEKVYIAEYYNTIAYFLTKEEAWKYIKKRASELNHPIVVSEPCGYENNGDFSVLSRALLRMGKILNRNER